MDRRRMILFLMCLLLSGFAPCAHFLEAQSQADRRADEMQKECTTLKARSISFEEEYAFGGAVSVNWVSEGGGLINGPDAKALHVQLNKIGKNLAAQSSRPSLPWTFGVLRSEGVNAVSGPGGYVFVSEGLLARLDNEAQLAGVLAHEIAHITGKHAVHEYHEYLVGQCEASVRAERTSAARDQLVGAVSHGAQKVVGKQLQGLSQTIGVGELRSLFSQMATQVNAFDFNKAGKEFIRTVTEDVLKRLAEKGFRKEDEFAADLEAAELMAAAGYAPEEYVTFLSKLPDQGLSTAHPDKQERQTRLRAHLAKLRKPGPDAEFTTSVDLTQTKVVPLRDALGARRTGSAARGN